MKKAIALIGSFLLVASLLGNEAPQSLADIQEQKALADRTPINGASPEFVTPLKTFETYFSALARLDASEFDCLTSHAIKLLFEVDFLSAAELDNIRAGQQARDEKEYSLVEFRYTADATRPKVTFGYTYNYPDARGGRSTKRERERITFVQTVNGWKIDSVEYEP
jgi:hypothetical protein